MQGISYLRRKGPVIERNDGIIRNRDQKENKSVSNVSPFVVSEEKFHEEIEKENNTDPELEFNKTRFQIERFIMKRVDGDSYHQEHG